MRDPPGMSDARWTFNPLPGDADSPARSDQACPPWAQSRQGWWPRCPGNGRQGSSAQGREAASFLSPPGPACGLRAPCSLQTLHAANGPAIFPGSPPATLLWGLLSLLAPPGHPKTLPNSWGEQSVQGTLFLTAPTPLPAGRAAERGRRALAGGHPDPPGAPQAAVAPGNRIRTKASTSLGMGSPV